GRGAPRLGRFAGIESAWPGAAAPSGPSARRPPRLVRSPAARSTTVGQNPCRASQYATVGPATPALEIKIVGGVLAFITRSCWMAQREPPGAGRAGGWGAG